MSFKATSWAIEAVKGRGLNWGAKGVLWCLADCHNPHKGCFPSQERLAEDCEMGRTALNSHLRTLERVGLIRRERRFDHKTGERQSTRYLLAFEDGFQPWTADESDAQQQAAFDLESGPPCSESEQGAMFGLDASPCSDSDTSHVHIGEHKPVIGTSNEPVVSTGDEARLDRDFREFWESHPRPKDRDTCRQLFREAVQAGEDAGAIIGAARRYATEQAGNKPMYICQSDNWLRGKRWRDRAAGDGRDPGPMDAAEFWAAKIRERAFIPSSAINNSLAAEMIDRGLITSQELGRIGVRV